MAIKHVCDVCGEPSVPMQNVKRQLCLDPCIEFDYQGLHVAILIAAPIPDAPAHTDVRMVQADLCGKHLLEAIRLNIPEPEPEPEVDPKKKPADSGK